jgi:LacI family transcriptional regulator
MHSVPTVLLAMDKTRAASIKILRGIAAYLRLNGPWKIHTTPPFYQQTGNPQHPLQLIVEHMDGIITYITEDVQVHKIIASRIPAVVIPLKKCTPKLSNITEHWSQTAKIAADHLLGLGLKHFAFYAGSDDLLWASERRKHFCSAIRKAGFDVCIYLSPSPSASRSWDNQMSVLVDWLTALPKPIGILAWNDECGQDLIDGCIAANIRVPDEVAVLGMDNDELVCDLSPVPLSSIVFNHEKVGYEAASLLHEMIKQKKTIRRDIPIQPLYIVTRRSTDILKIDDDDLAVAIKFIRDNTGRNLTVKEVVDHLCVSQRTLQKKFRKFQVRPLHDEIRFHRIERVCRMLEETNLSVSQIAAVLDFSEVSDLNRCFKKIKRLTPLAYRKKYARL